MSEEKVNQIAQDVAALKSLMSASHEYNQKNMDLLITAGIQHGKEISTLQADVKNNYNYLESVNKKIDKQTKEVSDDLQDHKKGHWAWVATLIGLMGIGGMVLRYLKV